jgi:cytochrome c oxidase subunit 3/cytochrome o ubiquinol oxidase subunit 3
VVNLRHPNHLDNHFSQASVPYILGLQLERRIWMTHSVDEHAGEPIHLPKPTYWPMLLGAGGGVMMLGFLWQSQEQLRRVAPLTTLEFWLNREAEPSPVKLTIHAGTLVFLAGLGLLLAAVGGWLASNIYERRHAAPMAGSAEMAKFGMWAYLGTECIIFGGLIARVVVLWMRHPDANDLLQNFEALMLVSANTFALLASSLGVVLALAGIQRGDRRSFAIWLGVTIALGVLFLVIQASEYSKLYGEGLRLSSTKPELIQFGAAFFFLTGFHGLHVFAGVIWAIAVLLRGLPGGFSAHDHMGVEIFGLYWHFVDVVWILIFTLVYLL